MTAQHKRINMGMIGGGPGSLIGPVHLMAASLDRSASLVCGAFSRQSEKNREMKEIYALEADRVYDSWEEMLNKEAARVDEQRMDFVVIATPNYLHHAQAALALKNGFHVLSDKPLAISLKQAEELDALALKNSLALGVTFTYTGYPMIRQARQMVKEGLLGNLRKIHIEYFQGWLSKAEELKGNKQAGWRTNPELAGPAGCLGDIGTHAFNLSEFVSGLHLKKLSARLSTFVPGRKVDDDVMILTEYENGASGSLLVSQVCSGEENGLCLKIYGSEGYLKWEQMHPNSLVYKQEGKPMQILRTGTRDPLMFPETHRHTRMPAGHPEGFIEAFANIYKNYSQHIRALKYNQQLSNPDFPDVREGLRSMAFVETVLYSSRKNGSWVNFPTV